MRRVLLAWVAVVGFGVAILVAATASATTVGSKGSRVSRMASSTSLCPPGETNPDYCFTIPPVGGGSTTTTASSSGSATSTSTTTTTATSSSTTTVTSTTHTTSGSQPPKPPGISGGQFNLTAGTLSFTISFSGDVSSLTIYLPNGVSFTLTPPHKHHGPNQTVLGKRVVASSVHLTGAKLKSDKFSSHKVTITLKSGSKHFGVKLNHLKVSSSLKKKIKSKKVKKLRGKVSVKATTGKQYTIHYTVAA